MRELPKLDLMKLQPTADQLARAREDLRALAPKAKHAKDGSLRAYMKKNPINDGNGGKLTLAERLAITENFQVMLNDFKDSNSSTENTRSILNSHKVVHKLIWESEEKLLISVGQIKGRGWIDGDFLPMRPDKVTKSMERYYVEFGRVADIEVWTDEDLRALKHKVEAELNGDDIKVMDGLMMNNTVGVPAAAAPEASFASDGLAGPSAGSGVKTSQELAEEQMASSIESLKADVPYYIKKYQDQELQDTLISTKAKSVMKASVKPKEKKRCQDLIDDLVLQNKRIQKLLKLLTRMITDPPEPSQLPKVVQLMSDLNTEISDNLEWAAKNDLLVESGNGAAPSKKKKRKRGEDT